MTLAQLKRLVEDAQKRWSHLGPEAVEVSVDGLAVSGAVVLTSAPGLVLATSRTVSFSRPTAQGYRAEAAALLASGGP